MGDVSGPNPLREYLWIDLWQLFSCLQRQAFNSTSLTTAVRLGSMNKWALVKIAAWFPFNTLYTQSESAGPNRPNSTFQDSSSDGSANVPILRVKVLFNYSYYSS